MKELEIYLRTYSTNTRTLEILPHWTQLSKLESSEWSSNSPKLPFQQNDIWKSNSNCVARSKLTLCLIWSSNENKFPCSQSWHTTRYYKRWSLKNSANRRSNAIAYSIYRIHKYGHIAIKRKRETTQPPTKTSHSYEDWNNCTETSFSHIYWWLHINS